MYFCSSVDSQEIILSGYQYGYGLSGLPGGFNPFLLNPGWLDAAYMSYAFPDYLRHRTNPISPQPNIHPSLIKGKFLMGILCGSILSPISSLLGPQLAPNVQPPHDFYIQPPTASAAPFHHSSNFLPNTMPPFPQDLGKVSTYDVNLRPLMPNPMEQLSLRLSPVSNSQSMSPQLSASAQETRIHSTVDQSSASEQSDEEDIDVVKSAFVPIKPASVLLQEIQHPDSTVQDKEPVASKCELKAPSSRSTKNLSVTSPRSPNTKIHSPPTISTTKTVWRPY